MKYIKKKIKLILGLVLWTGLSSYFVQGATEQVNIDGYNFRPLQVKVIQEKGQLLLSDSPEYVTESGILAAGTIKDEGRVYFYHVNESETPQYIGILLENRGTEPAIVEVEREILVPPSEDYFKVGRELSKLELLTSNTTLGEWKEKGVDFKFTTKTIEKQVKYEQGQQKKIDKEKKKLRNQWLHWESKHKGVHPLDQMKDGSIQFILYPGEAKRVFPKLEDTPIQKDELFSGIVDFHTSSPLYTMVGMVQKDTSIEYGMPTLPIHPIDDVELRGTYGGSHRIHEVTSTYHSDEGPAFFEIANDREDSFIMGEDELSENRVVKNKGNYGVSNMYVLHSKGNTPYGLYFNPLGGAFSGSIRITHNKGTSVYDIPKKGPYLGHQTIYDTQLLDVLEGHNDVIIEYMSPGASNLPVRFLLIPEEEKSDYVTQLLGKIFKKDSK